MSEKKETVEQEVITDPFAFGYRPGSSVTIGADLFGAIMQFIGSTAQEEISEVVVMNKFPLETGPELDPTTGTPKMTPSEVMMTITAKGKRAESIFNEMMNVHMENIENGLAVKEPNQPKVDLGN